MCRDPLLCRKAREGLTLSALRSFHEIGIHAYTVWAEPISNPSFRSADLRDSPGNQRAAARRRRLFVCDRGDRYLRPRGPLRAAA